MGVEMHEGLWCHHGTWEWPLPPTVGPEQSQLVPGNQLRFLSSYARTLTGLLTLTGTAPPRTRVRPTSPLHGSIARHHAPPRTRVRPPRPSHGSAGFPRGLAVTGTFSALRPSPLGTTSTAILGAAERVAAYRTASRPSHRHQCSRRQPTRPLPQPGWAVCGGMERHWSR